MKATIASILLCSSLCAGQDSVRVQLVFRVPPSKEVGRIGERGDIMLDIGYFSVVNLVSLWDEYRDSCWADSTREGVGWVSVGAAFRYLTSDYNDENRDGYFWMHREPTLRGFMEFIRRRMK